MVLERLAIHTSRSEHWSIYLTIWENYLKNVFVLNVKHKTM
jgi:hypothetical protein